MWWRMKDMAAAVAFILVVIVALAVVALELGIMIKALQWLWMNV